MGGCSSLDLVRERRGERRDSGRRRLRLRSRLRCCSCSCSLRSFSLRSFSLRSFSLRFLSSASSSLRCSSCSTTGVDEDVACWVFVWTRCSRRSASWRILSAKKEAKWRSFGRNGTASACEGTDPQPCSKPSEMRDAKVVDNNLLLSLRLAASVVGHTRGGSSGEATGESVLSLCYGRQLRTSGYCSTSLSS